MLAWLVAVPIGFVIVAVPGYTSGFLSKDDVLNVFVGTGADRFTRLGVVAMGWAFITAVLVHGFIEARRWWTYQRRRRQASSDDVTGTLSS